MTPDTIHEPTEGERARRAIVLGAALGLVLALLARRRSPGRSMGLDRRP
jgi:hypothetical protein